LVAQEHRVNGAEAATGRLPEHRVQAAAQASVLGQVPLSIISEARPRELEAPQSWSRPGTHLQTLLTSPWYGAVFEVFSVLNFASHDFFRAEAASVAFAPLTTGSISSPMGLGSDSMPVRANIGGRTVYLADSMQFALELALRVTGRTSYYLLPSFRGERSDARHLNQFIHAEAEMRGGLDDVIALVERYFRHLTQALLTEARGALGRLGGDVMKLETAAEATDGFPRVRFAEAVRILAGRNGAFERCETGDLRITSIGERALLELHETPVWITHMPARTVPFYQAVSPDEPDVSLTADLLAGTGETVGAGERARSEADVLANLARCAVGAEDYGWYLEMKRRQPVRTSGFGLGMERFLLWATGTHDIRDWTFLLRNEFGEGNP
jgi:aspartyl/asparaginyl-tRNA synthetase